MKKDSFFLTVKIPSWTSAIAVAALTTMVGTGCASKQKTTGVMDEPLNAEELGAVRLPDDTFDPACCSKKGIDLNGDMRDDAYHFSQKAGSGRVLVRKEIDVNSDGKIDLIQNYDAIGSLSSERLDTDFDGKIDVVNIYEKGSLARKEYDTNFDNLIDVSRFYTGGKVARIEADQDLDGRVDYWEYYENGKIDRSGYDKDGDGVVDVWAVAAADGELVEQKSGDLKSNEDATKNAEGEASAE